VNACTALANSLIEDNQEAAKTGNRVFRAWAEFLSGYDESPLAILGVREKTSTDEMVVVGPIDFTSICKHHLLPFTGTAWVGYIPNGEVVGLSKIPRLVLCFAKRLQLQEDLTRDVAESFMDYVKPKGVGVIMKSTHSCMSLRGVKQAQAKMTTSAVRGAFFENQNVRSEFLRLAGF
jgi:GTP cyclohydrolase I